MVRCLPHRQRRELHTGRPTLGEGVQPAHLRRVRRDSVELERGGGLRRREAQVIGVQLQQRTGDAEATEGQRWVDAGTEHHSNVLGNIEMSEPNTAGVRGARWKSSITIAIGTSASPMSLAKAAARSSLEELRWRRTAASSPTPGQRASTADRRPPQNRAGSASAGLHDSHAVDSSLARAQVDKSDVLPNPAGADTTPTW